MGLADTAVSRTFEFTARARRGRVFHPTGMPFAGRVQAIDPYYQKLLGASECSAVVRISKGLGLPGGVPDVLGLAFRVLDQDGEPWDLALATTGAGDFTRLVPRPARGWASARYGSLMAYRFGDGPAEWLTARPSAPQPDTAHLADLSESIRTGPTSFELTASPRSGPERTLAQLLVTEMEIGGAPSYFDPVRNCPADVEILPRALATVRAWAYAGSRRGSHRAVSAYDTDSPVDSRG